MAGNNTLYNSFNLQAETYANTAPDVFTAAYNQVPTMTLFNNSEYQLSLGGLLGWQLDELWTDYYAISLTSSLVQTWGLDCTPTNNRWWEGDECSGRPNYATPTFDLTPYTELTSADNATLSFDGYTASGKIVNTSIAIFDATNYWLASNNNSQIFVADNITDNRWNWYRDGFNGNIGFGSSSPVWGIFGWPDVKKFDVYVANMNNWTAWETNSWTATTVDSSMTLNGFNSAYDTDSVLLTIKPVYANTMKFQTN